MNSNAIVLAADSAMTMTRWEGGKEVKRYHNGANKIFQLSEYEPVGLMIYNDANVQGVPWELLVKEYRKHIGSTSFQNIKLYAEDFFRFVQSFSVFTVDYKEKNFINSCSSIGKIFFRYIFIQNDAVKFAESQDQKNLELDKIIRNEISVLDSAEIPAGFIDQDIDEAIAKYGDSVANNIRDYASGDELALNFIGLDFDLLAQFSIKSLYKKRTFMDSTGIVVAGYGEDDFFSEFYRVYLVRKYT
ncbi:hypothetical protein [Radicibacter daui]|uniref:hypothetical protein n=1 Tax=Radicibacter daui TaxID=3064829 RepID=UPI004046C91A